MKQKDFNRMLENDLNKKYPMKDREFKITEHKDENGQPYCTIRIEKKKDE